MRDLLLLSVYCHLPPSRGKVNYLYCLGFSAMTRAIKLPPPVQLPAKETIIQLNHYCGPSHKWTALITVSLISKIPLSSPAQTLHMCVLILIFPIRYHCLLLSQLSSLLKNTRNRTLSNETYLIIGQSVEIEKENAFIKHNSPCLQKFTSLISFSTGLEIRTLRYIQEATDSVFCSANYKGLNLLVHHSTGEFTLHVQNYKNQKYHGHDELRIPVSIKFVFVAITWLQG